MIGLQGCPLIWRAESARFLGSRGRGLSCLGRVPASRHFVLDDVVLLLSAA